MSLSAYHAAVVDFEPAADAVWREGGRWQPGLIVGHNDAAPYNAARSDQGHLVGFFDWDFAAPVSPDWDLAFTAFAWIPLHARRVVEAEGFTGFSDRPRPRAVLDQSRALLEEVAIAHWHGRTLRREQGVSGNFVDVDSGDEWWISGPKRDQTDARYSGQQPIVDDEVRADYEAFLIGAPRPGRERG